VATDVEIIDAHVHVACEVDRFPRQVARIGSSTWWESDGGADEMQRAFAATGVRRAVIVQAVALYGYDCRCAAEVARAYGHAFVGAIDLAAPDPIPALDALRDAAGVRLFGVNGGEQSWLTDGRGGAIFDWAAANSVSLVATLFAPDLAALGDLAEASPTVPVALDHCGFPDLAEDEKPLFDLAAIPSIVCKVTSHNLDRPDGAALLERLAAAFGADRLAWGSDFPQHNKLTYAECVAVAREATRTFSDVDRMHFFARTAERLWFR
jgi:predicted TIM-barrel fold metal-dependent hydrolase